MGNEAWKHLEAAAVQLESGGAVAAGVALPPAVNPWAGPLQKLTAGAGAMLAWDVPEQAQGMIAEGLADILNGWLPQGPANVEEWGPWGKVGAGLALTAAANFDWQTMRLRPLLREREHDGNEVSGSGDRHDNGGDRGESDRQDEPGDAKSRGVVIDAAAALGV